MKIRIIKVTFVAAIAMVSAINAFNANKNEVMSDTVLANVEALANGEIADREDCEPAESECSMIVVYPDGDYGEDIVFGMKKKTGWL